MMLVTNTFDTLCKRYEKFYTDNFLINCISLKCTVKTKKKMQIIMYP